MIKAYIVSTGTELLLGSTSDTNTEFLSRRLSQLGIHIQGRITAGDEGGAIRSAFEYGLERADMVISSGGMGPTGDDLTKAMACELMNCQPVLVQEEVERIQAYFARRGRYMPPANIKQAMFPPGAVILRNERGTAPGMYLKNGSKLIVLLPGPPHEMKTMYLKEVEPRLRVDYGLDDQGSVSRTLKVFGPGESQVEMLLGDLIEKPQGYNMALTVKAGEIYIGIQVNQGLANQQQKLDEITEKVKEILGRNIFGMDNDTLPEVTVSLLKRQGKRIAAAESCTGGLLAKMLTDLPGSSDYFWGGIVSYSNEAKQVLLGVKEELLDRFGAVSPETAEAMVRGLLVRSGTEIGVAITGIAGPSGGSEGKQVGLVYIAVMHNGRCTIKEMRFGGQRDMIRMLAARTSLDIVRRILQAQEAE